MTDTQGNQETAATPQPWFGRVLETLDLRDLPKSFGNIDDEPEWVFNVAVQMMQGAAPAFQFREARNLTPNFVGRIMGQQCANLFALGERFAEANLTPDNIKQVETILEVLDTKRDVPGVASALKMFDATGELVEMLASPGADKFDEAVHGAFRAALDQPKVFNRKDGSGKVVCIRHELALQPGLAVFEEYPELKDGKVKLDGDNVVEFHKLPELQQVTLKVLRWAERDKRLIIKEAQMVG